MNSSKYLIIGAGLAGSACAYLLKKAGCDVLLLERLDLSKKSKLCAGLITPRAMRMLEKVYGTLPEQLFQSHMDSMLCIADTIPVAVNDIEMKSVLREELDAFAVGEYRKAGGTLVDRFHIRDIDFANRRVTGIVQGGTLEEYSYDTLIAADGALSFVRKALTGSAADAVLSLEAETSANGSPLIMAYQSGFLGYSWYAPTGETAKIGCMAFEKGLDLDAHLQEFASRIGVSYTKRRGAFIPTGNDVLLEQDGVYFLGDAASLICPPSGEGIFYALHSAYKLSLALLNHANYQALMSQQTAMIRRQHRLRDLFFNTAFMTFGLNCAGATPYGTERAVKFALKHFAGYE